jgi:hypothetical protein
MGILRKLGRPPKQKLPITIEIMRCLYPLMYFSLSADLAFWAASLVCLFGLLRKGTLLLPTPNSRIPSFLVRSDVVDLTRHSFLLLIHHTKTIQFGQRPCMLPFVSCPDVRVCPVTFLLRHLVGSPLPATDKLFSYCKDERVYVLTCASFVNPLKI